MGLVTGMASGITGELGYLFAVPDSLTAQKRDPASVMAPEQKSGPKTQWSFQFHAQIHNPMCTK